MKTIKVTQQIQTNMQTKSLSMKRALSAALFVLILIRGDFINAQSTGLLNGVFSINDSVQVRFSQGNLQYIGSAPTPYWKFAVHQWEYLGNNGQGSFSQTVDRDLFGWGTSGYDHGALCYQPWSTSTTNSDYYAYGNYIYNLYDQTGKADWGYNAISNGGDTEKAWRTLTINEWAYLFNTRTTTSGIRYAKARVNEVNGVILLPDDWSNDYYSLNGTNSNSSFGSNIIPQEVWMSSFEAHGAVFLPSAGYRNGTSVLLTNDEGSYWSSTNVTANIAHYLYFNGSNMIPSYSDQKSRAHSVRLVKEVHSGYISDGLIMYLDGINNTRNGHSTTTNVWEDLMGNYDLALTNYSSYTWEDNHFLGLGNGGYLNTTHTWQYFNSLNDDITIEIVTYIDCDKTSPSWRGLAGWHEWSDGTNFQNDQGSGRMQTLGQLPVAEADDQIATVSYTRFNGSFLDGVWKTNASNIPNGVNSGYTVVFGNSHHSGRGWNDSIYCIRMYNRSLTPEEIAYNHSIDIERFSAGLSNTSIIGAYANPTEGGTVTGGGQYHNGVTCTLTATANEDYFFVNWMENGNVVSTETTYSFIVEGNRSLMANFANVNHHNNVYNGDFELGNVGFTSSYQYSTNLVPEGTYYIGENANNYHNGFVGLAHGGTGNFMIINGATEPGINVWTEQVTVIPNTNYAFSTWVCNVGAYNPNAVALLQFSINGVQLGEIFSCINELNVWEQFYVIWNSGNSTSATITILNQNTTPMGNDFGLDDIYFGLATQSYSINAMPNPIEGGSVTGAGTYQEGATCTLTATANTGYYFVNWTKDGEQVSSEGSYSFTVTENAEYVAHFECYDLGEFSYMSPTDNYPFTSLPITFSWDAVSGAEYYNLYLWNANDPAPEVPVTSHIYNRSCVVTSLQNHQTYQWYVEAVNACFTTESNIRNFTLNIPPTMNASTGSLDFGEVVLDGNHTLGLYVSGNALDDAITMQMTGEDASQFSFAQGSNWNELLGGSLSVTFSPTTVQYNYNADLVITSGTLSQTVHLSGSLADMFVFNTYVTQDVFEMNSTVPIYGTVTDVNNNPMAGAEVEVKVMVMGTTRSLFATTGDDGHFAVEFVPAYSESGYYTVNSGRVGHNNTAVHDDFNIPGMNLVTNGWILWDVVQNETTTGSIVIRNRSQIPLTNIQVTATNLPEGCSFTTQPLSLAGMEEGVLEYSVSGTTPTNGYQEVALVATSSEGASLNFTVWYRCAEPRGILYAAPNNITTTMTKGINKIVDVMLYNNGTGPTGSVYLDLPSVDWLSVVGNDTLPSIAVHDSAYFSLRLSANENTPLVQHTGNIAINCERGDGLSLPYTIMVVSDSTGTLIVDVTDDYTYNGNGQHLQGATVTVKGYYSLETVAVGLTDSNGLFTVSDIPEGYYRMSITASNHAEYQATIQIEGGQTNTQNIYLQYQAITYSWNVVPTEIQDEYTFELIVEYETNVPVPVVVIDMPQNFPDLEPGESFVFDYIITNYGLVDAYEATLYPPEGHQFYDFTPLITEIDTLHAQSSVVIPCTMTLRTGQRSKAVIDALGGSGNREETECPYSALTKTKQCYTCGDHQNWFWANVWRNIGSTPCQTAPATVNSGGSGPIGGGGYGSGSSSSSSLTPLIIVVHNQGCDSDPCLPSVKDDIDNCPNNGRTPPNLPLHNPANNR